MNWMPRLSNKSKLTEDQLHINWETIRLEKKEEMHAACSSPTDGLILPPQWSALWWNMAWWMSAHQLINLTLALPLPPVSHTCTHPCTQKTFHYIYIQLMICQTLPTYSLSIEGDLYLLILTFFFYTALF